MSQKNRTNHKWQPPGVKDAPRVVTVIVPGRKDRMGNPAPMAKVIWDTCGRCLKEIRGPHLVPDLCDDCLPVVLSQQLQARKVLHDRHGNQGNPLLCSPSPAGAPGA